MKSSSRSKGFGALLLSLVLILTMSVGTIGAFAADDVKTYTIKLTTRGGYGTVFGEGTFEKGDKVTVEAEPDDDARFEGWFDSSDTKLSSNKEYTFTVRKTMTLTASFVLKSDKTGGIGTDGSSNKVDSDGFDVSSNAKTPAATTPKVPAATATPAKKPAATTGKNPNTVTMTGEEVVGKMYDAIQVATGTVASVRVENLTSIDATTLKALADLGAKSGKIPYVYADTLNNNGKGMQGRLYVDASKLGTRTEALATGVYVEASKVQKTASMIKKYFNNDATVVSLGQPDTYGTPLKIAAKVDLGDLNADTLLFYAINRNTNQYYAIEKPEYSIDTTGYLLFTTTLAGDIVITDSPLTAK